MGGVDQKEREIREMDDTERDGQWIKRERERERERDAILSWHIQIM